MGASWLSPLTVCLKDGSHCLRAVWGSCWCLLSDRACGALASACWMSTSWAAILHCCQLQRHSRSLTSWGKALFVIHKLKSSFTAPGVMTGYCVCGLPRIKLMSGRFKQIHFWLKQQESLDFCRKWDVIWLTVECSLWISRFVLFADMAQMPDSSVWGNPLRF